MIPGKRPEELPPRAPSLPGRGAQRSRARPRAGAQPPAAYQQRPRPKQPETQRGRQLTSSRPSEPAASPGNVGGGAGRAARRAGLGPGWGPAHPLPQARPAPTGARHAAPRRTRARVSPRGAGGDGGGGRGAKSARPPLPCPTRASSGPAARGVPRPPRPRRARAQSAPGRGARGGGARETTPPSSGSPGGWGEAGPPERFLG